LLCFFGSLKRGATLQREIGMRRIFAALMVLVVFAQVARAAPECGLKQFQDLNRWTGTEPTCKTGDASCTYLAEEVAAVFSPYAVAAVGAYYSEQDKAATAGQRGPRARMFQLESFDSEYQTKGYIDEKDSGLGMRVHHKRTGDLLTVVTAFRGTDRATNSADMLSNFSWFTRWFRDNDQYKRALVQFEKVRKDAESTPGVSRIAYVTTGHSLGGGLDRHVARAFPCTAAVAFDSSFVTNEAFLSKTYDSQTVMVHESGDWFGRFANFGEWIGDLWDRITGKSASNLYRRYGIELLKDSADQHSIEPFAINMSRLQICCSQRQHWASQLPDAKDKRENRCSSLVQNAEALAEAQRFYCDKYRRIKLGPGQAFPAGDVCDFTSARRGEQCGIKRIIDQVAKRAS
jgi:hypothetical protein